MLHYILAFDISFINIYIFKFITTLIHSVEEIFGIIPIIFKA